jgi:uncharacterized protein YjbJ (UPF0337 family)
MRKLVVAIDHSKGVKIMRTLTLAAALASVVTIPATALTWDQVSGDWKQFEGRVQKQWGKLTNDDLQQAKGDQKYWPARSRNATA